MKLGDIIRDCNIVENMAAQTKEEAISELLDALVASGDIPDDCREDLMIALLKREAAKPTDIGIGIAVPHAQVRCISRTAVALGLSKRGISFGGEDSHVVILLVSPEGNPAEHLKFLALVSRLSSDPANLRSLKRASTRTSVFRIIREAEDRFADGPPPNLF